MNSGTGIGKGEKPDGKRSGLNRTLTLNCEEVAGLRERLVRLDGPVDWSHIEGRIINQDLLDIIGFLPDSFVDLLIIDPPYNRNKSWNGVAFKTRPEKEYAEWLDSWLGPLTRVLTADATVYICSDWQSSTSIFPVAQEYFKIRNRITWEREKGRGASKNWKNCSEDIWFCTVGSKYTFNPDAVKLRRRVIAPYTDSSGEPKDWEQTKSGNFRLTHPSNLWTDITVPFWSMPENTDHPTQKPEKMLAKLILASSNPGDVVFDPFLGVGSTAVTAKKLGRRYSGVEINEEYCCLAEKRLALAETDKSIQGYSEGTFWDRNAKPLRRGGSRERRVQAPFL